MSIYGNEQGGYSGQQPPQGTYVGVDGNVYAYPAPNQYQGQVADPYAQQPNFGAPAPSQYDMQYQPAPPYGAAPTYAAAPPYGAAPGYAANVQGFPQPVVYAVGQTAPRRGRNVLKALAAIGAVGALVGGTWVVTKSMSSESAGSEPPAVIGVPPADPTSVAPTSKPKPTARPTETSKPDPTREPSARPTESSKPSPSPKPRRTQKPKKKPAFYTTKPYPRPDEDSFSRISEELPSEDLYSPALRLVWSFGGGKKDRHTIKVDLFQKAFNGTNVPDRAVDTAGKYYPVLFLQCVDADGNGSSDLVNVRSNKITRVIDKGAAACKDRLDTADVRERRMPSLPTMYKKLQVAPHLR